MTRVLLVLIRVYQNLSSGFLPRCRFVPSCSNYTAESLVRFGIARGGWLSVRRLCRCHPLGGASGFDPVPETLDPSIR
ncbi:MAG TPA: membrane protein insertion efficiency factor YidD [Elusimicrobiota bacterium]|nr:membrane protein insertion efficiency factor YidD [Elusimicrobiota bacterium]